MKQRQIKYQSVEIESLRWAGDIKTAIRYLEEGQNKAVALGLSDIRLEIDIERDYGDSHNMKCYLVGKRLETDKEYEDRLNVEKDNKEYRKKQYEQLKKEFEDK